MPPRKGKNAKKKSPRNSSEEDEMRMGQIDIQYNPDIIDGLLQELSSHVDGKCAQIQQDSDFLSTSIQQAFHLELIKLPNQVKKMSVKRFKEEFGFSLEAVTKGVIIGSSKSSNLKSDASTGKSSRISQQFFQTPSHKYLSAKQTPARVPREGEVILSENGSPLGEFTTVKKAPRGPDAVSLQVPATPGVFVPLNSGEIIDLECTDLSSMPQEKKEETLEKMQEVMNNMQAMMALLSKPTAV